MSRVIFLMAMIYNVAIQTRGSCTAATLAERVRQRIGMRFVTVGEGEAQPLARRVVDDAPTCHQVIDHLTQPGLKRFGFMSSGFPPLNEGRSYGSRSSDVRVAQLCGPSLSTVNFGFTAEVMAHTAVHY